MKLWTSLPRPGSGMCFVYPVEPVAWLRDGSGWICADPSGEDQCVIMHAVLVEQLSGYEVPEYNDLLEFETTTPGRGGCVWCWEDDDE